MFITTKQTLPQFWVQVHKIIKNYITRFLRKISLEKRSGPVLRINQKQVPTPTLNKKGANDPSAGSPTETLLRLLLPLNDKV